MQGKLDGTSLRVPVPDGSITDFVGVLEQGRHRRRGQRGVPGRGRVGPAGQRARLLRGRRSSRSDIVGSPASCTFDCQLTMVSGNLVKVLGWYDNEWGYSNRLVDLAEIVGAANK